MVKKKENYIVINGIRYDVVEDKSTVPCVDCDLFDKCDPFGGNFICNSLYDVGVHFEKLIYEDY